MDYCQLLRSSLVIGVSLAAAPAVSAQTPRPSQRAAVFQSIGRSELRIDYSRPVARGRALFGALVPWGKPWNPGADSATRIQLSTDVSINGKPLAAGDYSLWVIPDPAAWTIIFSTAAHVYHTPYPEGRDALRIRVAPRTGTFMETLGLYFPMVDGTVATLYLHWGTTVVPLTIVGRE
jgi:hypothetical protein